MKKILIVDDSKTNRLLLKAIIEDFIKIRSDIGEIKILEAENGQEALETNRREKAELIFMDIMMPVMDGIEATTLIRQEDKKTMIIAASALDDDFNKAKILSCGAEDYIVKPINGEVLKKRLEQYFELIGLRHTKRFSSHPYNLMDCNIYSRKLVFMIDNELHLSEFWEYFLISEKSNDEMAELVKILYGIGAWQLKLKYKFEIIVEESEEKLYFTMNNLLLLKKEIIERIISKNYPNGIYKTKEDKLTFLLTKRKAEERKKVVTQFNEEAYENAQKSEEVTTQHLDKVVEKAKEEAHIFDFIDDEDLEELESIAGELNSMMLLVGSSKLEESEIASIASYIEKFSKILSHYPETYQLYQALFTLSQDILENITAFNEKSKDIAMLCLGFNNDLNIWMRKLFYEGAPSINFLDNSIISNANMISSFIKPQLNTADDIDDIFDF